MTDSGREVLGIPDEFVRNPDYWPVCPLCREFSSMRPSRHFLPGSRVVAAVEYWCTGESGEHIFMVRIQSMDELERLKRWEMLAHMISGPLTAPRSGEPVC